MGIAALAILITHAQLHGNALMERFGIMCQGGVDLFLFLSGYGIFYSYLRRPKPLTFYRKRALRILPTFWIILALSLVYNNRFTLKVFLLKATTLCYWFPIDGVKFFGWFVSVIVLLYALFPLYWLFFRQRPLTATLAMTFVGIALSLWYTYYYMVEHHGAHGRFILFTARIPVFYWGVWFGYLSKCRLHDNDHRIQICLIALSAVTIIAYYYTFPMLGWYNARNSGLLYYPFVVILPGLCLALAEVFRYNPSWLNSLLATIGGASLESYLLLGDVYNYKAQLAKTLDISKNTSTLLLMFVTIVLAVVINKTVMRCSRNWRWRLFEIH